MEIIGRDKITQTGNGSVVKINNEKESVKIRWHQTWWGVSLIGFFVGVSVVLFAYFTQSN